ncbi:MAG: hypothetical protein Q8P33_00100 [bacterium]|nr:hypothetical protein [bacterium]
MAKKSAINKKHDADNGVWRLVDGATLVMTIRQLLSKGVAGGKTDMAFWVLNGAEIIKYLMTRDAKAATALLNNIPFVISKVLERVKTEDEADPNLSDEDKKGRQGLMATFSGFFEKLVRTFVPGERTEHPVIARVNQMALDKMEVRHEADLVRLKASLAKDAAVQPVPLRISHMLWPPLRSREREAAKLAAQKAAATLGTPSLQADTTSVVVDLEHVSVNGQAPVAVSRPAVKVTRPIMHGFIHRMLWGDECGPGLVHTDAHKGTVVDFNNTTSSAARADNSSTNNSAAHKAASTPAESEPTWLDLC